MALPAALQHLARPVIASPMFIVSYPELVLAQCKAGIVGSFPALNARPAELLDEWLTQIGEGIEAHKAANPGAPVGPVAVNQIVHHSNARLEADVRVCVEHRVPIFITSLRAPVKEMIDAVHSYGGKTYEGVSGEMAANVKTASDAILARAKGSETTGAVPSPADPDTAHDLDRVLDTSDIVPARLKDSDLAKLIAWFNAGHAVGAAYVLACDEE